MSQGQKVIKYLAIVFAACLTISILGVVLNVIVSIFGAFIPKQSKSIKTSQYSSESVGNQYDETFGDIKQITVDSGIYMVKLVNDKNVKGVRVTTEDVESDIEVSYDVDDKRLKIEQDVEFDDFFKNKRPSKGKIFIYTQDALEFEKVDIDMGVGKFEIEGITTDKLDVDCGVGNLICKDVKANDVDIDGGVGSLKCEDVSFQNLSLEGGVGEIDISGKLRGKTQLSAGMGEVNVDIDGKRDDYNLKVETGLGAITIDGEKYKDTNITNNSQSNILDIEGGVGSVRVDFH